VKVVVTFRPGDRILSETLRAKFLADALASGEKLRVTADAAK
jgi:hypothetical protein